MQQLPGIMPRSLPASGDVCWSMVPQHVWFGHASSPPLWEGEALDACNRESRRKENGGEGGMPSRPSAGD